MGNNLSNAEIDVEETMDLALAVTVALSHESGQAAEAPVDPDVVFNDGVYLRRRNRCGEVAYLRQGVCLSHFCQESYLSLNADEVGKRLQSWGSPTGDAKADPAQLQPRG